MTLVLKVILGLMAALLLMLWGRWTFTTDKIAAEHGITSSNATARNFLKGDIGGLLLSGAILIGLFLYQGNVWFYPVIIVMVCVILGRVIGLISDGMSKPGLQAIIVETIIIALMFGIRYMS